MYESDCHYVKAHLPQGGRGAAVKVIIDPDNWTQLASRLDPYVDPWQRGEGTDKTAFIQGQFLTTLMSDP